MACVGPGAGARYERSGRGPRAYIARRHVSTVPRDYRLTRLCPRTKAEAAAGTGAL